MWNWGSGNSEISAVAGGLCVVDYASDWLKTSSPLMGLKVFGRFDYKKFYK